MEERNLLNEPKTYIGAKIVRAIPMTENEYLSCVKLQVIRENRPDRDGYKVIYPDGYVSWSPKSVFEEAYRQVNAGEKALVMV